MFENLNMNEKHIVNFFILNVDCMEKKMLYTI